MATGINSDKVSQLKVSLLDYVEQLNSIKVKLENCEVLLKENVTGAILDPILKPLENIILQIQSVKSIVNNYVSSLSVIVNRFVENDQAVSSELYKNIDKLDG